MGKASIAHLVLQPTAVVATEVPLQDLPEAASRVPGMEDWYRDLRLRIMREREQSLTYRQSLTNDSGLVVLSPSRRPVQTPTRTTRLQPCIPPVITPTPPVPPSRIFVLDLIYLKNQDTGDYCPLTIIGQEFIEQLNFGVELPFAPAPVDMIADVIYLKNTDTGKYCPLTIIGDPGIQQLNFGTEVVLTNPVASLLVNIIYLQNQTTGQYCTVTLIGAAGAEQLNFGAEVVI